MENVLFNKKLSRLCVFCFTLICLLVSKKTEAQCWDTIVAGYDCSIAIKKDGTLWAWGDNFYGQLGNGTNVTSFVPIQVGTANNWKQISNGFGNTMAIKTDGTLWAWGRNNTGQLGDGTFTNKNVPVQIGTATNWKYISSGAYHSIAVKTDGTLWAWGDATYGQVGNGTISGFNVPTQIGSATNWDQVAGGFYHSLAIKTDGTLWAWGDNAWGQVGDGTNTNKLSPVQIGTATNWKQIAGGHAFSLALRTNGTLWAWGINSQAQLGDGTTTDKNTPIQIGAFTNYKQVSAGSGYGMAIKTDGTLWGWGINTTGQLGDGTTTTKFTPTQIGTLNNWKLIDCHTHGASIKTDGTLWTWGFNGNGRLGDGTTTNKLVPTFISTTCPPTCVPTITITSSSSTAICQGVTVTFSASISNGGSLPGYQWKKNASNVGTNTGTFSISNLVSGDVIQCLLTSNASCATTSTALSNSFTFVVNPTPTITTNGTSTICSGTNFTITPTGASTYTYSSGSNVVSPTSNQTYTIIGASVNGCTNSAITTISVTPNPTITVNSGAICSGSTFTIIPSGALTYTYSSGSSIVNPTTSSLYTVTGSNAQGCLNTAISNVTVNPLPTINLATSNTLICIGQSASLTANGATSYTWNTNATSNILTISPTVTTVYTVTGIDANGCNNIATITQSVSACTSIKKQSENQVAKMSVYPNPSHGSITIDLIEPAVITITNALGQIVLTEKLESGKQTLTIQDAAKGLYFVLVKTPDTTQNLKLLVE